MTNEKKEMKKNTESSEKKKELSMEELEQVTGGVVKRIPVPTGSTTILVAKVSGPVAKVVLPELEEDK